MPEFYLDGIRIMQPLKGVYRENAESITPVPENERTPITLKALNAYSTDGEANLDVVTLREKLLEEWPVDDEAEESPWDFVVLTDTVGNIVKASEYESIGPKEEVYLAASYAPAEGEKDADISAQKVSFSLMYWQPEGLKLYMGMKAPFGHAYVNVGSETYELENATDCYYDVTNDYESLIEEEVQLTTKEGWNVYTDQNGNTVYEQYDPKTDTTTFFDENRQKIEVDDLVAYYEQLTEVMTTCYIVTYSFEAAQVNDINSVVSLTNIKVVGSHEFTIIRDTDIVIP